MSRPGRNGRSAAGSPLSAGLTLLIVLSAGIGPARRSKARDRRPPSSRRRALHPGSPPRDLRPPLPAPADAARPGPRRRPLARRPGRPVPGARGGDDRGPRPGPDARAAGRRRGPAHRRPEARRRLPAADRQPPRAPGRRAVPRHRGRGAPASSRGDRPRQVSDPGDLHVRGPRRGAQPGPPGHQGHLSRGSRPGAAVPHAQGPDPDRLAQSDREPAAGGVGAGAADGDRAARRPSAHARGGRREGRATSGWTTPPGSAARPVPS